MRRAAWIGVLVVALLAVSAISSHAGRGGGSGGGSGRGGGSWRGGSGWHGGHVHGRFFVGPRFGWGAPYWWGAPYPYWGYYGAPYYAYAPPVVVEEQQTYVQAAPEPAPAPLQQPKSYWYYCASAGAYYPTAPTCPEVWIKVPPRTE